MTDIHTAYADAVLALRDLGAALIPATAAQYLPPPGSVSARGTTGEMTGISNPTLDTVLDGRRMGLSETVNEASRTLSQMAAGMTRLTAALRAATDRWEGLDTAAEEGVPFST